MRPVDHATQPIGLWEKEFLSWLNKGEPDSVEFVDWLRGRGYRTLFDMPAQPHECIARALGWTEMGGIAEPDRPQARRVARLVGTAVDKWRTSLEQQGKALFDAGVLMELLCLAAYLLFPNILGRPLKALCKFGESHKDSLHDLNRHALALALLWNQLDASSLSLWQEAIESPTKALLRINPFDAFRGALEAVRVSMPEVVHQRVAHVRSLIPIFIGFAKHLSQKYQADAERQTLLEMIIKEIHQFSAYVLSNKEQMEALVNTITAPAASHDLALERAIASIIPPQMQYQPLVQEVLSITSLSEDDKERVSSKIRSFFYNGILEVSLATPQACRQLFLPILDLSFDKAFNTRGLTEFVSG